MSCIHLPREGSPVLITCDKCLYHGHKGLVTGINEFKSGRYVDVSVDAERCRRDEPVVIRLADSDVKLLEG